MSRASWFTAATLSAMACAPAVHPMTSLDDGAAQSERLLQHFLPADKPGCSVAVSQRGQVVWANARGMADVAFAPDGKRWRLTLSEDDADWLLRLINDLRVGSWIKIKCPDFDAPKPPHFRASDLKYLALMENAGRFEIALIEALSGPPT